MTTAANSPIFVLVHGAFQGAACWESVVAALKAKAQTVITVELPGRGEQTTPLAAITLDTYRDVVRDVIEQQDAPVVLVGHSFGGIVISTVAEAISSRIQTLVYLAAYLPRDGESLVTLSGQDKHSVLGQPGNFIIASDYSVASVNRDVFASGFCPDGDEAQRAEVAASQQAEPLAPLNTPVALTPANYGSVARAYILTAQDMVVSPQLQALMLSHSPAAPVFALNTGHAPYVTAPAAVADLLIEIGS